MYVIHDSERVNQSTSLSIIYIMLCIGFYFIYNNAEQLRKPFLLLALSLALALKWKIIHCTKSFEFSDFESDTSDNENYVGYLEVDNSGIKIQGNDFK